MSHSLNPIFARLFFNPYLHGINENTQNKNYALNSQRKCFLSLNSIQVRYFFVAMRLFLCGKDGWLVMNSFVGNKLFWSKMPCLGTKSVNFYLLPLLWHLNLSFWDSSIRWPTDRLSDSLVDREIDGLTDRHTKIQKNRQMDGQTVGS